MKLVRLEDFCVFQTVIVGRVGNRQWKQINSDEGEVAQLDCLDAIFFWVGLCNFLVGRLAEQGDGSYVSMQTEISWYG